MSIKMMIDEKSAMQRPGVLNPDVYVVWNFWGHAFDEVRHDFDCPNYKKGGEIDEQCVGNVHSGGLQGQDG